MIVGSLLLPVDRRRRLPDRDDALQQRVRARPADRRAAQPQLLHLALPDGARRDGLLGRPRLRVPERPEDGDPDQDELHGLDADVQLLRHRPGRRVVATTGERVNWRSPRTTYALDPYAPRGSVRTVSGSNQSGFDVTVTRKVYEHGKLKRQRRLHERVHRRRPDADLRPRPLDPGPVLRACRARVVRALQGCAIRCRCCHARLLRVGLSGSATTRSAPRSSRR